MKLLTIRNARTIHYLQQEQCFIGDEMSEDADSFFFLQLTLSVKKRTLGEKRKAKMRPEILMLCSKVIQIMKTPNTIHLIVVHMSRKGLPGIV